MFLLRVLGSGCILFHLLHADYLTLIAESGADLQELFNCVSSWCQKWHIRIAASK